MIPEKTLADLGWSQLLDAVAARARTDMGAAALRELAFFDEPAQAEKRIAEISEARTLAALDAPMPFGGVSEVGVEVARAEKGAVLETSELVAVADSARGCYRLAQHLKRHADHGPLLAGRAEVIEDLGHMFHPILESIDGDGRLVDHASDELGKLRRRVAQLRNKLDGRIQALVDSPKFSTYLQDKYYTQRDERYVLPIKAESRAFVKGIVHGTSQSGHTVFLEPEEIVELNNALRLAECDVVDEERRILIKLTGFVAEEAGAIRRALEAALGLDVIGAAAQLADDLRASPPTVDEQGRFALLAVRHPLMELSERDCVPNDISLAAGGILVISGPNAGGKTVALKTAGLAALMVRAGLHIAAAAGSRVPWLVSVLSDIGDSQSIEHDLSTFSAHVMQLERFTAAAGPGTLLLIDELAVGTDPDQGAALARAVLEEWANRGVAAIVTTHYEALKSLAASDDRFANASVGFDMERMEPTFKLHLGSPGSSGALFVARRLGLPETVVARAEELLGSDRTEAEEILASLDEQRRLLDRDRQRITDELEAARIARRATDSALAAAVDKQRELREGAHGEAVEALRQARTELDRLRGTVKRRTKNERVSELKKDIGQLASAIAEHAPEKPPAPGIPADPDTLAPGASVFVMSLGCRGEVVSAPERGKVVVQVGALRTTADVSDLRVVPRRSPGKQPPRSQTSRANNRGPAPVRLIEGGDGKAPARTVDTTVDVRGERVDEAVSSVDRFIDKSMRAEHECIFVIHGHGTGALRSAIREYLAGHAVVSRFRGCEPDQGGDGVTVAWLDVS